LAANFKFSLFKHQLMNKVFIFALFMALIVGCKKEETTQPTATGKKAILVGNPSKSWVISKIIFTFNGADSDVTSSYTACQLDNFTTFKADGTVISDEGAKKCNATDKQTTTGTYAFNAAETEITIVDPAKGSITAKVLELTNTKFIESITTTANGLTSTTTTTFIPK
jgi:hypothetical protein